MAGEARLWQKARADLQPGGPASFDALLWEHSLRVARASQLIVALPDLAGREVDTRALLAAALYHDAGWALQLAEGAVTRNEVLTRPTSDLQRELAASRLEQSLHGVLSAESVRLAASAIREMNNRHTTLTEAQILVEAENFDEIGPLSFWLLVRRHAHEGRGVQAAIEAWARQREYGYWEARIKDCFRFESVRRLARARLERLEGFLEAVAADHRLDDLEAEVRLYREPPVLGLPPEASSASTS